MVGLPETLVKFNYICVVVDRLTKESYFFQIRTYYNAQNLAKLYKKEIVRIHGGPFLSSQAVVYDSHPCFKGNCMMSLELNSLLL